MPELPEIYHLKDQLEEVLIDKIIKNIVIKQPKSFNLSHKDFSNHSVNTQIEAITAKGKWLFIRLSNNHTIAINLGMGGELTYLDHVLEKKHQGEIHFTDNSILNIRFWWFGHVHLIKENEKHKPTDSLAIDYFDKTFTKSYFKETLKGRRGMLKNILLNQKVMSGIGNYYIHDILYVAKIHPKRKIPTLKETELARLYEAINTELYTAYTLGGSYYEQDIYQNKGQFKADKVAYKEDKKCPLGHVVKKIKTGQTTSYICPVCQK
ncbi:MAG: DNA-formamidopyrimidine glycosylase family protein [Candidatus Izemoplasma sp.]|nr:DNA-formamidopyrimidine glycosylase family protein [Candidatus Izemoplasma sp.]